MAIVRTGTAVSIAWSGSSSQSITVPADAEIAVAFGSGYWPGANRPPNPVFTLGGTPMTRQSVVSNTTPDNDDICVETLVSPPTGTQTLAWSVTGYNAQGGIIVVFYKGINTSSAVRATTGQDSLGTGSGETVSITGLTYQTGDMLVAGVVSDASSVTITGNGQTSITTEETSAVKTYAGEKASTGDFTATGVVYGNMVAVVLAATAPTLAEVYLPWYTA